MALLKNKNLVTVNEFAELFSYKPNHVRRLIYKNKIPATRIKFDTGSKGAWRIDLDAVNLETNEINYHETNLFDDQNKPFDSRINIVQKKKLEQNPSDYLSVLDQL